MKGTILVNEAIAIVRTSTFTPKLLFASSAILACAACGATEKHRYECPSPLTDDKGQHALKHVDVFDGPPKDQAFLQGWMHLKGRDIYLVCAYDGTDKVVTIHAQGVNSCDAPDKPNTAFCD